MWIGRFESGIWWPRKRLFITVNSCCRSVCCSSCGWTKVSTGLRRPSSNRRFQTSDPIGLSRSCSGDGLKTHSEEETLGHIRLEKLKKSVVIVLRFGPNDAGLWIFRQGSYTFWPMDFHDFSMTWNQISMTKLKPRFIHEEVTTFSIPMWIP